MTEDREAAPDSGKKAGDMPKPTGQPSGEAAPGDGSPSWSETSTGPDGLPAGTDAASGPGSDGPV